MNSLANCSDRRGVYDTLRILPAELNATYDISMARIAKECEPDYELAMRVLSWVTHACRPLSFEELRHALAVCPGMTIMDVNALVHEGILTAVCAGLVVVDDQRNVVHLVRE